MESAIPTTMRAYRFKPSVADPVCEKIDVPRPGPDEVLLKILAAGVCHSDITFLDPNNPISKLASDTLTMGHEGAGIRLPSPLLLGAGVNFCFQELLLCSARRFYLRIPA